MGLPYHRRLVNLPSHPRLTRRLVRRRAFSAGAIGLIVFLSVLGLGAVVAVYRPLALALAAVAAVGTILWLRERRG